MECPNCGKPEQHHHKIRVYRDHPEWETCGRWFQMRLGLLEGLHVATYRICGPMPEQDDPVLREVEEQHERCVYVY